MAVVDRVSPEGLRNALQDFAAGGSPRSSRRANEEILAWMRDPHFYAVCWTLLESRTLPEPLFFLTASLLERGMDQCEGDANGLISRSMADRIWALMVASSTTYATSEPRFQSSLENARRCLAKCFCKIGLSLLFTEWPSAVEDVTALVRGGDGGRRQGTAPAIPLLVLGIFPEELEGSGRWGQQQSGRLQERLSHEAGQVFQGLLDLACQGGAAEPVLATLLPWVANVPTAARVAYLTPGLMEFVYGALQHPGTAEPAADVVEVIVAEVLPELLRDGPAGPLSFMAHTTRTGSGHVDGSPVVQRAIGRCASALLQEGAGVALEHPEVGAPLMEQLVHFMNGCGRPLSSHTVDAWLELSVIYEEPHGKVFLEIFQRALFTFLGQAVRQEDDQDGVDLDTDGFRRDASETIANLHGPLGDGVPRRVVTELQRAAASGSWRDTELWLFCFASLAESLYSNGQVADALVHAVLQSLPTLPNVPAVTATAICVLREYSSAVADHASCMEKAVPYLFRHICDPKHQTEATSALQNLCEANVGYFASGFDLIYPVLEPVLRTGPQLTRENVVFVLARIVHAGPAELVEANFGKVLGGTIARFQSKAKESLARGEVTIGRGPIIDDIAIFRQALLAMDPDSLDGVAHDGVVVSMVRQLGPAIGGLVPLVGMDEDFSVAVTQFYRAALRAAPRGARVMCEVLASHCFQLLEVSLDSFAPGDLLATLYECVACLGTDDESCTAVAREISMTVLKYAHRVMHLAGPESSVHGMVLRFVSKVLSCAPASLTTLPGFLDLFDYAKIVYRSDVALSERRMSLIFCADAVEAVVRTGPSQTQEATVTRALDLVFVGLQMGDHRGALGFMLANVLITIRKFYGGFLAERLQSLAQQNYPPLAEVLDDRFWAMDASSLKSLLQLL